MKASVAGEIDVRIVKLEPMRMIAVRAVSANPERDAWAKLEQWAAEQGFLDDLEAHPVFGFNNPNPLPGSTAYGYEFWMRVFDDTAGGGEFEPKLFAGGWFAVTRCKLLGDPHGSIQEVWRKLWHTIPSGRYRWRQAQELERPLDPRAPAEEMELDLYLPVEPVQPA